MKKRAQNGLFKYESERKEASSYQGFASTIK
ncbi:hypothetical protein CPS_3079 [Colwellia psychrerythraea 34H]|uniref:Uncharacterized protein n=1 Tax=Colwellia psychrerythraea (strain 34H / ATCC BAA-681) TaxID=167879 RepID=Q47ZJ3_COLP3|nr:hypothetical protein CPS_3079 [Colwellia psychrerythraea 34H]